jgi:hypothetical protein
VFFLSFFFFSLSNEETLVSHGYALNEIWEKKKSEERNADAKTGKQKHKKPQLFPLQKGISCNSFSGSDDDGGGDGLVTVSLKKENRNCC